MYIFFNRMAVYQAAWSGTDSIMTPDEELVSGESRVWRSLSDHDIMNAPGVMIFDLV